MVFTASSFGNPEAPTAHGGPAFDGWRNGFGFGKARGPGGYVSDPSIPRALRFTPAGDRCYASSAFWRQKHEVGQASGFGIGDRPDYGRLNKDFSVAPDNYGDISRTLKSTRRNATRSGIGLKPRFPSMEERYRELSWPKSGPGPGKYNTSIPAGQSSWVHPAKSSAWSMPPRPVVHQDLKIAMEKPGPAEYETRAKPGKNASDRHGTLYDVSMKGKIVHHDLAGEISPGPAKYSIKGHMDYYGLGDKIANVRVPRRRKGHGASTESLPAAASYDSVDFSTNSMTAGTTSDELEHSSSPRLTRVDSAPV